MKKTNSKYTWADVCVTITLIAATIGVVAFAAAGMIALKATGDSYNVKFWPEGSRRE